MPASFAGMDTGLAGKGVIVTGGAGGIGSAVSRAFASEGATVAVHYRTSQEAAVELAAEIDGIAVGADLRQPAEVDALFAEALDGLGRLDVCVANAGVWPRDDVPIRAASFLRLSSRPDRMAPLAAA